MKMTDRPYTLVIDNTLELYGIYYDYKRFSTQGGVLKINPQPELINENLVSTLEIEEKIEETIYHELLHYLIDLGPKANDEEMLVSYIGSYYHWMIDNINDIYIQTLQWRNENITVD